MKMPTNIEMQHRPAPCNYERNTRLYRIEENKRHNRTFDTFTYLDLVGNGAVIAVVVMGLDDVPVLLARDFPHLAGCILRWLDDLEMAGFPTNLILKYGWILL